jgi:GGDEF domain-containing protein
MPLAFLPRGLPFFRCEDNRRGGSIAPAATQRLTKSFPEQIRFLLLIVRNYRSPYIVVEPSKERSLRVEKNAAVADALTGLPNWRAFFEGARKMKAAQARKGQSIAA